MIYMEMLKATKLCFIEFNTNILSTDSVSAAIPGPSQAEIEEKQKFWRSLQVESDSPVPDIRHGGWMEPG